MYLGNKGLLIILVFYSFGIIAQEDSKRLKFIAVDGGFEVRDYEYADHDFIRADKSAYGDGELAKSIVATNFEWYSTAKVEFQSKNNRFGFGAGVRYTSASTVLNNDGRYFYLVYDIQPTETRLLRVREISQNTTYMGIPLEVKIYFNDPGYIRLFVEGTLLANYLVGVNERAEFFSDGLEKYEQDVLDKFDDPVSTFTTFAMSIGISGGKPDGLRYSVEALVPSLILSGSTSTLAEPIGLMGTGVQFGIKLPF